MGQINFERIIAFLGLCIWFVFPLGMFLSIVRQDPDALPAPTAQPENLPEEPLHIFEHKKMIYDESEQIPMAAENSEHDLNPDEDVDFDPPHVGIGSTHIHHIH